MRLTKKEIARAEGVETIAVRPQADKTYSVFLVKTDGTILIERKALNRINIPYVVADLLRDCNKYFGRGGQMSDASRDRNYCSGSENKITNKPAS